MANHKKRCRNRTDVSLETEARVQDLKKKVNDFLDRLPGNFAEKLDELHAMFQDENNSKICITES